jgi:hypothetical protein
LEARHQIRLPNDEGTVPRPEAEEEGLSRKLPNVLQAMLCEDRQEGYDLRHVAGGAVREAERSAEEFIIEIHIDGNFGYNILE